MYTYTHINVISMAYEMMSSTNQRRNKVLFMATTQPTQQQWAFKTRSNPPTLMWINMINRYINS